MRMVQLLEPGRPPATKLSMARPLHGYSHIQSIIIGAWLCAALRGRADSGAEGPQALKGVCWAGKQRAGTGTPCERQKSPLQRLQAAKPSRLARQKRPTALCLRRCSAQHCEVSHMRVGQVIIMDIYLNMAECTRVVSCPVPRACAWSRWRPCACVHGPHDGVVRMRMWASKAGIMPRHVTSRQASQAACLRAYGAP